MSSSFVQQRSSSRAKADEYVEEHNYEHNVRSKRSFHGSLKKSVRLKKNLIPQEWQKHVVLPATRNKYGMAFDLEDDDVALPSDSEEDKDDQRYKRPYINNEIKHFWSDSDNGHTNRRKGMHSMDNTTVNINHLGAYESKVYNNKDNYDDGDYDTEMKSIAATTLKPKCEYSGPVKTKQQEESVDNSWKKKQYEHQGLPKEDYDSREDYNIFDVPDTYYDNGALKEQNEDKVDVYDDDGDDDYIQQRTTESYIEMLKALRKSQESQRNKDREYATDDDDSEYNQQKTIESYIEVLKALRKEKGNKGREDVRDNDEEDHDKGEDGKEGSGNVAAETDTGAAANTTRWPYHGYSRHHQSDPATDATLPYMTVAHFAHAVTDGTTSIFRNSEWEHFQPVHFAWII